MKTVRTLAGRSSLLPVAALTTLALPLLAGCGGGGGAPGPALVPGSRPVQLGPGAGPAPAGQSSVLGPLNEPGVRRAIANLRISKKRSDGPVQIAGADLNGDSVAEAQRAAYECVGKIDWPDVYYRTDIGYRALTGR